ncbi:MAG: cytochrome c [Fimbriiglobus sp.]|nr:cytochrome c [Fimbriiglobus sp.]
MSRTLVALLLLSSVAVAADPPTFHKDVAPILFSQCATCHRDGQIGPFPLLKYDDAKKRAKQIARVTADKVMPPWKPDAGHIDFRDARILTDKQLNTLKDWAAAGAPEGDPKDGPPVPKFKDGWQLGKPDIVLKMAEPFTVPAEGRDIYQHFVFPLDIKKEIYVVGVECRPGNPKVAHHAVGILDTSGGARKMDAKHAGPGYPGLDVGFIPAGFTPGYVPGQTPRRMKEGSAITIKPGTDFVLQMHYHPSGKEEKDQTEIGLYLSDKPPTNNSVVVAMASDEIDIPAGEKAFKAKDVFTLPADMEVESIWPHMHCVGKTVNVTAELPDGKTKDLLRISDWDFNWQDTYVYAKPLSLPKGTKIVAEFTWDNSADNPRNPNSPPKRIKLGEGSLDEMSGLIIGGQVKTWQDSLAHWGAVIGHYAEVKTKGWVYQQKVKK